ncbi:hypothetical protein BC938DRAFT_483467 [Jimgerdemannia flammicorona]|uniref:Uncharacterized protein n=1 Tax=Jimgerdemannia flammicorona TaxID=994334 RepID=A0A433QBZ4_9FUNG|nr:hypothetical protein BC938DRAFT_483467 [Jimgerdemannia flammicorona]
MLTKPGTVIISSGGSSQTFSVGAGITKLSMPLQPRAAEGRIEEVYHYRVVLDRLGEDRQHTSVELRAR